jgi:hypothetical protein
VVQIDVCRLPLPSTTLVPIVHFSMLYLHTINHPRQTASTIRSELCTVPEDLSDLQDGRQEEVSRQSSS